MPKVVINTVELMRKANWSKQEAQEYLRFLSEEEPKSELDRLSAANKARGLITAGGLDGYMVKAAVKKFADTVLEPKPE